MKNNEREMTQEARQNIVEAMNSTFGYTDTDNPCKLYTAPGEICVSRLEYSVLLRKAQRYDMLISALLDIAHLNYCNELDISETEKILRIFEKEKCISREKKLLEEREARQREDGK